MPHPKISHYRTCRTSVKVKMLYFKIARLSRWHRNILELILVTECVCLFTLVAAVTEQSMWVLSQVATLARVWRVTLNANIVSSGSRCHHHCHVTPHFIPPAISGSHSLLQSKHLEFWINILINYCKRMFIGAKRIASCHDFTCRRIIVSS